MARRSRNSSPFPPALVDRLEERRFLSVAETEYDDSDDAGEYGEHAYAESHSPTSTDGDDDTDDNESGAAATPSPNSTDDDAAQEAPETNQPSTIEVNRPAVDDVTDEGSEPSSTVIAESKTVSANIRSEPAAAASVAEEAAPIGFESAAPNQASPKASVFSEIRILSQALNLVTASAVSNEVAPIVAVAGASIGSIPSVSASAAQQVVPGVVVARAAVTMIPHVFSRVDGSARFDDSLQQFIAQCATLTPAVLKKPLSPRAIAWITTALVIALDVCLTASLLRRRRRSQPKIGIALA